MMLRAISSLNRENVIERPIKPLRRQVAPAGGVDQLRRDPDPLAGLAKAAFKHVANAKLARDIGDLHGAAFEDEGRVARDHVQSAGARQLGDQVLNQSVGEIFLFDVAAHVGERQHRYADRCEAASPALMTAVVGGGAGETREIRTGSTMRFSLRSPPSSKAP